MFWLLFHLCLVIIFMLRILWRNDLDPVARLAWFAVLALIPYIGVAVYWLFGENNIGSSTAEKYHNIFNQFKHDYPNFISPHIKNNDSNNLTLNPLYQPAFHYATSINGFQTLTNNQAELMANAHTARQRLLEDIQQAKETVHILYYIWLADHTGIDMANALIAATKRGVTCRVIVDALGSRQFIKSEYWQQMQQAGVELAIAFAFNNPIKTILTSRIDLRNHRKITIIDNQILYCGSQNCADPEFRIKPKFAPWVDILLRFEGGVVQQMQLLFWSDWLVATGEELDQLHFQPSSFRYKGFPAQVVGDGPTERKNASPQLFSTLFSVAREKITLSTPYFVPDSMTIESLCAAALRGVEVTIIFPQRNDSWVVSAASRSHYLVLLKAGITIYEFKPGLLHAKTLTIDNQISFIGSTNLDLRSFNLNYENDILLQDPNITNEIYQRQLDYISQSNLVTLEQIANQPIWKRIWQNIIATIGPVL